MAFTKFSYTKSVSDLLVDVPLSVCKAYNIDPSNVTPPDAGGTIGIGDVVFRAKSFDQEAPWGLVTSDLDLVDTNEVAIVIGNHYEVTAEDFVPFAITANKFNAMLLRRGPVEVKDLLINAQLPVGVDKAKVAGMLLSVGIHVLKTV